MNINYIINNIISQLPEYVKKYNKEGKEIKASNFQLAIHIMNNCTGRIVSTGGKIFLYYEGCSYGIDSSPKTRHFIKLCLKKVLCCSHISAKMIEEVTKEINTYYHEFEPIVSDDTTYVNMKSNVVAIKNDGSVEILPHSKKFNFLYKLNYDYKPNAKAEVFEKFLHTSLGHQELHYIIFEYLAYVLIKNTKNFEKALFLYGSGSNGKSTLLNVIKHLFGKINISHVELSQMGTKEEAALMDGKLLNISSDAKKNGLDTSAFKKIVSGEPILGKYLFKDIYTIENLPKLIIAMNKLPFHGGDNTHGFFRRLLLIHFNTTIKDEDKDYDLERNIVENELSGIFNLVIEGLIRLVNQGGFTKSKIMDEVTNQYIQSSNHVPTFLEEESYEVVPESTKKGTSLKDLFADFKQWCLDYGHNPYSANYLSNELDQLGYKSYKNSSKHYRIVKKKLQNTTGFTQDQHQNPYTS